MGDRGKKTLKKVHFFFIFLGADLVGCCDVYVFLIEDQCQWALGCFLLSVELPKLWGT